MSFRKTFGEIPNGPGPPQTSQFLLSSFGQGLIGGGVLPLNRSLVLETFAITPLRC
jgi:hypothetical protein